MSIRVFMAIPALLLSLSAWGSQRPRDFMEWRRHQLLAQTLQCEDVLTQSWSADGLSEKDLSLPRLTINPSPSANTPFAVGELLSDVGDGGAFLIGWPPGLYNSFRHKVTIRLISPGMLGMGLNQVGQRARVYLSAVGGGRENVWLPLDHAEPDGAELQEALLRDDLGLDQIESLALWIEHGNSNPPLANEVASFEVFRRLGSEHFGLPRSAKLSLHVIGPHQGQVVVYSIDFKPTLYK